MSTTEETRAVVEGIFTAAGQGDFDKVLSFFDENAKINPPPYWPWGKAYPNRQAWVEGCLSQLPAIFDGKSLTIEKIIAEGDQAVAIVHTTVLESGADSQELEVFKVKDGKAVEVNIYCFDPRGVNEQIERVAARNRAAE